MKFLKSLIFLVILVPGNLVFASEKTITVKPENPRANENIKIICGKKVPNSCYYLQDFFWHRNNQDIYVTIKIGVEDMFACLCVISWVGDVIEFEKLDPGVYKVHATYISGDVFDPGTIFDPGNIFDPNIIFNPYDYKEVEFTVAPEKTFHSSDINKDGSVNLKDIIAVLQVLSRISK